MNKLVHFKFFLLGLFTLCMFSCKTQQQVTLSPAEVIHQYMDNQEKELAKVFPDATVSILDDSIRVTFKDGILFESGSYQMRPEVSDEFVAFSKTLNKYNKTRIIFNGHTDNVGSEEMNFKLSQNRANTAKDLAISNGVNPNRLMAYGLGKSYPVATNSTSEGRSKNRRIEIIILYDDK